MRKLGIVGEERNRVGRRHTTHSPRSPRSSGGRWGPMTKAVKTWLRRSATGRAACWLQRLRGRRAGSDSRGSTFYVFYLLVMDGWSWGRGCTTSTRVARRVPVKSPGTVGPSTVETGTWSVRCGKRGGREERRGGGRERGGGDKKGSGVYISTNLLEPGLGLRDLFCCDVI